jgi:hypothetical protein
MQMLDVRHPGLIDKVQAMFAEFWSTGQVKHMIQAQYGVRLSRSSVDRYKRRHWQARRELVQQASAALAAPQEFAGEARLGVR